MKKAVFGLVENDSQANRIVDHLLSSGFSNEDISILCSDRNDRANGAKGHLTTEKHTKAPEGGVAGVAAGGILGGSLGLLAGIGALAIPGLGAFIAAGPIMAALSGTAVGGSLGLVIGALVGAGIPEYEATIYEAGLKNGSTLISVHTDSHDEVKRAKDVLKKEGAKDISTNCEKAISKK